MRRIPSCESGWNPFAYNGHPRNRTPTDVIYGVGGTPEKPNKRSQRSAGTYQFMPSTWLTTPYAAWSIWSAKGQALAAAFMVRSGRSGEWVCR